MGQGVYQLFHKKALVYVGQARSLKKRLAEHYKKISGRRNIDVADMDFKCLYVHPNWTALAPEDALIKHHRRVGKACPWNGNGFGPHDPGRNREDTNKPIQGFDKLFPIRDDWPCSWVKVGEYGAFDLLTVLKKRLPFLLRFEMAAPKSKKPHPDYLTAKVKVPADALPAKELLRLIAKSLNGWQATKFPGHMILYKEDRKGSRAYTHGEIIWPQ